MKKILLALSCIFSIVSAYSQSLLYERFYYEEFINESFGLKVTLFFKSDNTCILTQKVYPAGKEDTTECKYVRRGDLIILSRKGVVGTENLPSATLVPWNVVIQRDSAFYRWGERYTTKTQLNCYLDCYFCTDGSYRTDHYEALTMSQSQRNEMNAQFHLQAVTLNPINDTLMIKDGFIYYNKEVPKRAYSFSDEINGTGVISMVFYFWGSLYRNLDERSQTGDAPGPYINRYKSE